MGGLNILLLLLRPSSCAFASPKHKNSKKKTKPSRPQGQTGALHYHIMGVAIISTILVWQAILILHFSFSFFFKVSAFGQLLTQQDLNTVHSFSCIWGHLNNSKKLFSHENSFCVGLHHP